MLTWQTEQFLARESRRTKTTVYVDPPLVVEIAIDGVQASTRYPGGVALRFARVLGYRPDKSVDEVDTLDAVIALGAPGGRTGAGRGSSVTRAAGLTETSRLHPTLGARPAHDRMGGVDDLGDVVPVLLDVEVHPDPAPATDVRRPEEPPGSARSSAPAHRPGAAAWNATRSSWWWSAKVANCFPTNQDGSPWLTRSVTPGRARHRSRTRCRLSSVVGMAIGETVRGCTPARTG